MAAYRLTLVWLLRAAAVVWLVLGVINAWTNLTLPVVPAFLVVDQMSTAVIPSLLLAAIAEMLALLNNGRDVSR